MKHESFYKKSSLRICLCLIVVIVLSSYNSPLVNRTWELKPSEKFKHLIRKYCKRHYGMNTCRLINPQMIVIHCTHGNEGLAETMKFFSSLYLNFRSDIERGGRVNVSVHFIVDRNGRIYSLLPLSFIGRHAIGFNHTAVGIENIGLNNSRLTKAQVESNKELVIYLKSRIPSLKYLIGHNEYNDKKRPHYRLIICRDKSYTPYRKYDPGRRFMRKLRARLKASGVEFID